MFTRVAANASVGSKAKAEVLSHRCAQIFTDERYKDPWPGVHTGAPLIGPKK